MARKFTLNREETQEKTLEERATILEKKEEFDLRFIDIDWNFKNRLYIFNFSI